MHLAEEVGLRAIAYRAAQAEKPQDFAKALADVRRQITTPEKNSKAPVRQPFWER